MSQWDESPLFSKKKPVVEEEEEEEEEEDEEDCEFRLLSDVGSQSEDVSHPRFNVIGLV